MADQGDDSSYTPYNGTILTIAEPDLATPIKEFFRLPLRERNEIVVSVKASYEAGLILYDKSSNASEHKVEIVIGGSKNTTASIGLQKSNGINQNVSVQKDGLLSATHFKAFKIRWYHGRVMIYNEGFKKPFLVWDGPKEATFSNIGVKTVGCSGEWVIQGLPILKTADSNEYQDTEINCGRFDFEVKAQTSVAVVFTPEAKWADAVHVITGFWTGWTKSCVWNKVVEVTAVNEAQVAINVNEYRQFWVKWDACNFMVGRDGTEVPFLFWGHLPTPIQPLRYFGLLSGYGYNALWHVLEKVTEDDVATNPTTVVNTPPPAPDVTSTSGGGDGSSGTTSGGGQTTYEQTGYVVFRPTY